MKNIDKEPTYYVSLTEYNEVKRMFLKANDEINTLKDLLKEVRQQITKQVFGSNEVQLFEGTFDDKLLAKINQVLGEE